MLATAPEPLGILEPLRLLLVLLRRDREQIPDSLKKQAMDIIEQAKNIANNPSAINENTLSEAIALAFAMRASRALAKDIDEINGLESIDRARADSTLEHLNAAFVG